MPRGHGNRRRARRIAASAATLLALAAVTTPTWFTRAEAAPRLAGLLDWTPRVEEGWPWSGAFVYPVGDSLDLARATAEVPGYHVNRGVSERSASGAAHRGADLANGRAGGRVRAAAHGVVVNVHGKADGNYGVHVVLAHRLNEGGLAYTVYAHLAQGSTRLVPGAAIHAGETVGRVGQTGRATTPHLHFEVRLCRDSTLRWEKCEAVDPVAFVRARLPGSRDDDWSAPYLTWAELGGLVPHGLSSDAPVDRALLDRMWTRAGVPEGDDGPWSPSGEHAHHERRATGDARHAPGWREIARGLTWLRARARRLAPCPAPADRQRARCVARLGLPHPARSPRALAARASVPTVAEVCLVLSDLAPARASSTTR